jgi:hypothetical protein
MSDNKSMPSAVQGATIIFSTGLRVPILGRRGDLLLVLVLRQTLIPVQYLLDRTDIEVKGWLSADLAEAEKDEWAITLMDSRFEAATTLTKEQWDDGIAKMHEVLF